MKVNIKFITENEQEFDCKSYIYSEWSLYLKEDTITNLINEIKSTALEHPEHINIKDILKITISK